MDINKKDENKQSDEQNAQNDLESILKEKAEYLEGWKRAKADLINYKKDEGKRFESIIKFSNEGLLNELLVILDSFDLAESFSENDSKAQKGFLLIKSQLEDILKRNGLERIKIEIGEEFNPEIHEAFEKIDSKQKPDTIVEEIETGYKLNGKVVRPTKVKVAK